jgi:TRAF3-interacting protein 1
MADLDSLIAQSNAAISALISKPKMTDKLLSKPPFRFLHDIVSAITTTTGFAEGLFQAGELDSAAITDKQAKMDYLDKIINFVGICKGQQLDIRSIKVVAGLEPECTNLFLISLAEVASDASYDSPEALRRAQAGEIAGSGPPARKVRPISTVTCQ